MAKTSLPKTAPEAKLLGAKFFFTGEPCKYGHIAKRRTNTRKCVECEPRRCKESYWRNHETRLATQQRWKDEHRPEISAYMQWYNRACAEEISTAKKACYQARKDHYDNINRVRARHVARRATPAWLSDADWAEMLAIYAEARRVSKVTGIHHEVDHIVPILGPNVCGLHVPWNLQVLTRFENRSKGNKHDFE